ncbi:MAG: GYD domain-containing protein [Deltaproteobacteria bacterium]
MPHYLWHASYTAEGTQGLMKEGGSKRREAVKQMIERGGGKLHAFYYTYGESDVVGITEFPDDATALAMSMVINASGVVTLRSTPLLSPEVVDAAVKKQVGYRAPGA